MAYDDEKLKDYATKQAWNNFCDNGGKVEDYIQYSQIKEDIKEVENSSEKENENN